MHEPLMPTEVSFSLDVPHETSRSLSGSLQARLQPPERSVEELRADSERATERTRQLREAHIESVKERAARESQRCDEVAARKRRMMHEEAQTLVARMGMKDGYYDAFLEDKREKQESEKARRAALAEAASASRLAADQEKAVRGVRMAERVEQAAAAHDRQVEEVVKRNSHQVQHAQQVAAAHKEYLNSERCGEKDEQTDASDAGMLLPSPHLSAAATASPVVSIPSTPRPADAALSMATPIAPAAAPSSAGAVVGERKLSPRKQQQLMVPLAKKSSMLDEAEAMPKQTLSAQITPRVTETPRRPEMPTILEEEFEDSDRWLDLSRPMERSFERIYYKVELPNGGGFTYCYCIQWADGSTRWVHGVPAVVACAGRQHRARRGF